MIDASIIFAMVLGVMILQWIVFEYPSLRYTQPKLYNLAQFGTVVLCIALIATVSCFN